MKLVSRGGDKGRVDVGSLKDTNEGEVAGKVMTTHIPTSLLVSLTRTSTTTTTRTIVKGVVIGERVGGFYSSSMKPPLKDSQGDKGKGVLVLLLMMRKRSNMPWKLKGKDKSTVY